MNIKDKEAIVKDFMSRDFTEVENQGFPDLCSSCQAPGMKELKTRKSHLCAHLRNEELSLDEMDIIGRDKWKLFQQIIELRKKDHDISFEEFDFLHERVYGDYGRLCLVRENKRNEHQP